MNKLVEARLGQPNEVEWAFIMSQFARPFEVEDLKFVQSGGGNFAGYANVRTYQDRLNLVVGSNWEVNQVGVSIKDTSDSDTSETTGLMKSGGYNKPPKAYVPITRFYGGVMANISVFGVTRSDIGEFSNTSELKGAFSDSVKRAAVSWGIGRYIYNLGFFKKPNPELPDFAIPDELPDFDELIKKAKVEAVALGKEAKYTADYILDNYSPLVSLLQKRRTLFSLREILRVVEYSPDVATSIGENLISEGLNLKGVK